MAFSINRNFIQGVILVAFFCFLLGFICQVMFHLLPAHSTASKHNYLRDLEPPLSQLGKFENLVLDEAKVVILDSITEKQASKASVFVTDQPKVFVSGNHIHAQDLKQSDADIPNIVRAWRNAKLDWHSLIPKHNSEWERFGTPQKEGKLRLLVSKEILVTDYLTRFKESGLASKYGYNHGNLLSYSGCNVFATSCAIHSEEKCTRDNLCSWSSKSGDLCVEGASESVADSAHHCENPKLMGDQGFETVNNPQSECKVWSSQPAVLLSIDSESQTMFYHWWASWSSVVDHWSKVLQARRDVTYFLRVITDPMFFQYFGLLSDNCWRHIGKELNKGICFCDTKSFDASQARINPAKSAEIMVSFLGLEHIAPPVDKVKIGLISRRRKRFILNEYALVERVLSMGYECELLPLESMTLYEQIAALRSLDVLIGIHGSALDNSVFLHPGSVMLQLLPYKVEHRVTFRQSAESAGVKYMEWQLKDPSQAFFHWDMMEAANSEKMKRMSKSDILNAGQVASDNRETIMFWINQDIIVPIDEWTPLVVKAAKASQAEKRGARVEPLEVSETRSIS